MEWLFDYHSFITRNHCGHWTDALIATNQVANFLIFLAYFTIPLSLLGLWRRLRTNRKLKAVITENTYILLMFVVFILACGLTHLMDVLAFSWAPYRFFTLIDVITALASIPTAFVLPNVIGTILDATSDD